VGGLFAEQNRDDLIRMDYLDGGKALCAICGAKTSRFVRYALTAGLRQFG